jgi:serine/threonine-protein kinase
MTERDLFEAALDLPPESRGTYLDGVCAGDVVLRHRLEGLLSKHGRAGSFLEPPAVSALATVEQSLAGERPGTRIGPYKLLEQIGEGGFGVVFLAEQEQPVHRKVALKVLKAGMDTRQVIARFEAERQALALMDHSHIARVFDGGETAGGRPYFVMELVRGIPITDFCDQNQLSVRERLALFVNVCHAMQHAHQKGIIHRDLKPSNVLVTFQDGARLVKVIDFGVAKALGQPLTDKTLFTGLAQMIGTPLYMSPEQAALTSADVDTRSDLYSLGVLLYELLTGTTPLEAERYREAGFDELRRVIRDEDPPPPSHRISTLGPAVTRLSTQRRSDARGLSQVCRGELDSIVMKCLEKDPSRRYESAGALAADVQAYLHDGAVQAVPPSAWYRLRKSARRHKTALAVAALVLFFIGLLGGGAGWVVRDRMAREQELALERATRQDKLANQLALALDRAELFQGQGKRPETLAALERAELLVGEVPAGLACQKRLTAVKERLAAEARDRQFMTRFEEIRLHEETRVNLDELRFTAGFPELRQALHRYGIVIGVTTPAQVATIVRGRPEPVRCNLIAALDECLRLAPRGDAQTQKWLFAAEAASDQDAWRTRVRKARHDRDGKALEQLGREVHVRKQPPSFLLGLALQVPSRLELLRRIQQAYTGDLWANLALAMTLRGAGRPAESIRYYNAALALRPRNPALYLGRGTALKAARELDAAIADFHTALDLAPPHAAAHNFLGLALLDKHQLDEAVREFRRAIALNPKLPPIHTNLGIALYLKRQPDAAIREFRTAIALEPNGAMIRVRLSVALRDKDPNEAIRQLRKAIKLDAHMASAHSILSDLLFRTGRIGEAFREIQTAIRLDPHNAELHGRLCLAHATLGQWNKASAAYNDAVRLDPNKGWWWYMSAALRLYTGDLRGYRMACYQMLMRFANTDNPDVAEQTAKTCLLAPNAVFDVELVRKLADFAVARNGAGGYNGLTKALVEYRAGRFTHAVKALQGVGPKANGESLDATAFAILAMAHKQQGRVTEARQALDQARAILAHKLPKPERRQCFDGNWHNWLRAQILCNEAASLLGKTWSK